MWTYVQNHYTPEERQKRKELLKNNATALWADENADLFKCDGYYNNTKKQDLTEGCTHCGASGHTFLTCNIAHHKFGGAEK
jgi:hypothetical protein